MTKKHFSFASIQNLFSLMRKFLLFLSKIAEVSSLPACIFTLLLISEGIFTPLKAQKIYFDKSGKATSENQSYYYRQPGEKTGDYKSYYVNGGSIYFEGSIIKADNSDENQNLYSGTCTWYYKNGKKKSVRTFDKGGIENGTSFYYYESSKLWKEIQFSNGKIVNNNYLEYDEDGKASNIWDDDFINNQNDWDLYVSDKSSSALKNGTLELTSFTKEGTSRFINLPAKGQEFVIEANIDLSKMKDNEKAGLIYGFKDWQNYNFFLITSSSFYVGTVYEGVKLLRADGMFSGEIEKNAANLIKIIALDAKNVFSINGVVQITSDRTKNFGKNYGFALSGSSTLVVENFIYKDIDYKSSGGSLAASDYNVKANGSGFIFSTDGYILTNYHVIENANQILVEHSMGGITKSYVASLIQKDLDNDLAILKIKDDSFRPFEKIQYAFKESGAIETGASVFTIGYPHALSGMGKGAKFTDGKISSKTGYNGAINSCQTSIPVQPGNSGGPLFNEKGQLIGIINSKIKEADNVSYAIKLNYLKNLIELLPDSPSLPSDQCLNTISIEEKVKILFNYMVLVKIK